MDFITPETQRQVKQAQKNREIEITSAKIQVGSTAEIVAQNLYEEILKYQASLPDTEDVALAFVCFNQTTLMNVTNIGYIGYNLISFHGADMNGKPLELIQNVQQLNFLLTVAPKPEPNVPKRKIGFAVS